VLRYAEESDIGKWPKMPSWVEHSQRLKINFNIFNILITKNTVLRHNCSNI